MVICLERDADLHIAQLMPLPLTVSCFSKMQIGFTFLVPAHPGSSGQRAVKRVCMGVCRGAWNLLGVKFGGHGPLAPPLKPAYAWRRGYYRHWVLSSGSVSVL